MTKKWEITYWVMITTSIIIFVVDLMLGRYKDGFYMAIQVVWLYAFLRTMKGWQKSSDLNDTLLRAYSEQQIALDESKKREKIAISEYQKARKELEKIHKA